MAKKQKRNNRGIITVGGNLTLPGQKGPNVIVLTQPKRFGIDIADYMTAIRAAENVDYSRRYKLYDLYADILMDTHLTCVIEKRKNAVLCSDIEFRRNGKPDDAVNEQIRSPWFNRLVGDIIDAKFWGFSLCQFYREGEWVDYDLIPRKHVDPVRRIILRHQTELFRPAVHRQSRRLGAAGEGGAVGHLQTEHHRRLVAVLRALRYAHTGVCL